MQICCSHIPWRGCRPEGWLQTSADWKVGWQFSVTWKEYEESQATGNRSLKKLLVSSRGKFPPSQYRHLLHKLCCTHACKSLRGPTSWCHLSLQMFTPEEKGNAEKFLASIRKRTDPFPENSQLSPVKAHPSPTVKGLRAMLTEAKALLGEVSLSKNMKLCKVEEDIVTEDCDEIEWTSLCKRLQTAIFTLTKSLPTIP